MESLRNLPGGILKHGHHGAPHLLERLRSLFFSFQRFAKFDDFSRVSFGHVLEQEVRAALQDDRFVGGAGHGSLSRESLSGASRLTQRFSPAQPATDEPEGQRQY